MFNLNTFKNSVDIYFNFFERQHTFSIVNFIIIFLRLNNTRTQMDAPKCPRAQTGASIFPCALYKQVFQVLSYEVGNVKN